MSAHFVARQTRVSLRLGEAAYNHDIYDIHSKVSAVVIRSCSFTGHTFGMLIFHLLLLNNRLFVQLVLKRTMDEALMSICVFVKREC